MKNRTELKGHVKVWCKIRAIELFSHSTKPPGFWRLPPPHESAISLHFFWLLLAKDVNWIGAHESRPATDFWTPPWRLKARTFTFFFGSSRERYKVRSTGLTSSTKIFYFPSFPFSILFFLLSFCCLLLTKFYNKTSDCCCNLQLLSAIRSLPSSAPPRTPPPSCTCTARSPPPPRRS